MCKQTSPMTAVFIGKLREQTSHSAPGTVHRLLLSARVAAKGWKCESAKSVEVDKQITAFTTGNCTQTILKCKKLLVYLSSQSINLESRKTKVLALTGCSRVQLCMSAVEEKQLVAK